MFFDFSGGGLPGFDPANSPPSGPPWGIKGVLLLYLKTNTSLLHARDLTRPRPQGPGEFMHVCIQTAHREVFLSAGDDKT